jgi:ribosomal silencing factor RsfS
MEGLDALQRQHRETTDRELLLLTVQEMGHMNNHLADLAKEMKAQNGRISALEKWRWWLIGAGAVVVPLSPLLVYEVRQAVFGGFGG